MAKKMTKVISSKRLSRTTSDERRGTISWALTGWACKLECGHTVKRSASGRHSPPDRCHCTECAAASAEVPS